MEQATNTFNKGLLLDTNPMVLGNDTLTDCLNGTLITMNGNEIILQNDMGNRRVDNAFLPSGYEPVGMKEYGGIIYVAAYNPITNKSLIGSFPSPLKKIDSLDDPNLKGTFDFDSFLSLSGNNVEHDPHLGINVIKVDSFMIPLTGDTSLRAGDKFAIYSSGLSSMSGDLTNYNNIQGNKAYSPKNRKYTLLIGVLNSLNEFVDITKTLCRWKSNILLNYSSEKSDIYKFNDGYFISDYFSDKLNGNTIEDSKLIRKRQKIAANTYSYKLIGPMYLKASLNHIENFNYNIYGTAEKENSLYKATLWIEGYLNYNCPDGFTGVTGSSNEFYYTFSEGESTFSGFDLYGSKKEPGTSLPRENSIYNSSNNLYTTKIVKKYTNITATNGNIYNYVIGVLADKDTQNVYLKGLSVKGQLDLSLLGSGKVYINGWRFYNNFSNDKNTTTLTFSFNAYPEYGKEFGNLKFIFHDITAENELNDFLYPKEGGLPLYNGRLTYIIDWTNEEKFECLKVYKVTIKYDIINKSNSKIDSTKTLEEKDTEGENISRWFLTTELFNEFYSESSNISDFCTTDNEKFLDKMNISFSVTDNLIDKSILNHTSSGNFISTKVEDIKFSYEHKYNIDITSVPVLTINKKELYPDYINILDENSIEVNKFILSKIGNIDINTNNNNFNLIFKSLIPKITGTLSQQNFDNDILLVLNNINISNFNKITGELKYYDLFKSISSDQILEVTNAFDSFSEIIDYVSPKEGFYGGILVAYIGGADDDRYVDAYIKCSANKLPWKGDDGDFVHDGIGLRVAGIDDESGFKQYYFQDISGRVFEHFNNGLSKGQCFMYLGPSSLITYSNNNRKDLSYSGDRYARVWWKTYDGTWALFKDLYDLNSRDFKTFIANSLLLLYIYCMHNTYLTNGKLYSFSSTDYIYNNKYNIPIEYQIKYKLKENKQIGEVINTKPNSLEGFGNLIFNIKDNYLDNIITIKVFNLDSSDEFQEKIINFDKNNISKIDVSTGLQVDSDGLELNVNYIYEKDENNLLKRIENPKVKVDFENKTADDKNVLVYNRLGTYGKPSRLYDFMSADDGCESSLDYSQTLIVDV